MWQGDGENELMGYSNKNTLTHGYVTFADPQDNFLPFYIPRSTSLHLPDTCNSDSFSYLNVSNLSTVGFETSQDVTGSQIQFGADISKFASGSPDSLTSGGTGNSVSSTTPEYAFPLFQEEIPLDTTRALHQQRKTSLSVDDIIMSQFHDASRQLTDETFPHFLHSSIPTHDMQLTKFEGPHRTVMEFINTSIVEFESTSECKERNERSPMQKNSILKQRPSDLTARLAALVGDSLEGASGTPIKSQMQQQPHQAGIREVRFLSQSAAKSFTCSDITAGDYTWGLLAESFGVPSHGDGESRVSGFQANQQIQKGMVSLEKRNRGVNSTRGMGNKDLAVTGSIASYPVDRTLVLLKTRLFSFAEAVATDDQERVRYLFGLLHENEKVGPTGNPLQRTAYYAMEALRAKTAGRGFSLWKTPPQVSNSEMEEALTAFTMRLPCLEFAVMAANDAILNATDGESAIHIVDFGFLHLQWPAFMRRLARQPGGPPFVRITSIDSGTSNVKHNLQKAIAGNLKKVATQLGIAFRFDSIKCNIEDFNLDLLNLKPGEALAINCAMKLYHLPDASVVRHSPRDLLIQRMREACPSVVVLTEMDADQNGPFFLSRFREAVESFGIFFENMETAFARDCPMRTIFERDILGRDIINVIACEGVERVVRAETLSSWQKRMRRACFTPLSFSRRILDDMDLMLRKYSGDFGMQASNGALQLTWKGRSSLSCSSWRPLLP